MKSVPNRLFQLTKRKKFLFLAAFPFAFSSAAVAEIYLCEESATVTIDQFETSSHNKEKAGFKPHDWIIDTSKGWRRSDFPDFQGSCLSNKGYVVCKTENIAFGEATLSIHPSGSSFAVVYLDYGIGVLAFVGECSTPQSL